MDRYQDRTLAERPLRFAERDVDELAAVLRARGFTVWTLTGAGATKDAIDRALKTLLTDRWSLDLLVIGFVGHGVQMPLEDEAGEDVREVRNRAPSDAFPNPFDAVPGDPTPLISLNHLLGTKDEAGEGVRVERNWSPSDAFLCPFDAVWGDATTMISLTRLLGTLDRRGASNLLMVDACRDAPVDPDRGTKSLSGDELVGRIPRNAAILFSGSAGQQALETDKAGGGHGVFFYHVIEAIKGRATNAETGEIWWDDLVSFLRENVNRRAREWEPERARRADERTPGVLQTPHTLSNLIAPPVVSRGGRVQDFAGSIGIKMVPIFRGGFWMGTSYDQADEAVKRIPGFSKEGSGDERPRHWVLIKELEALSAHEVTVGQFRGFVEDTGYRTEAERDGKGGYGFDAAKGTYGQDPKSTWRSPGFTQADDHPVVNVSWNDAMEFCQWLSRRTGRKYRLPTEAEWEYCCRAGSETYFSNGDDPEAFARAENVADTALKAKNPTYPFALSAGDDGHAFTAPVGDYAPNAWGLHDLHGNVSEWCLDFYDWDYYKGSPELDPTGPSTGEIRVIRGGNWARAGEYCRSARRTGSEAAHRFSTLGFRVARVPSGR